MSTPKSQQSTEQPSLKKAETYQKTPSAVKDIQTEPQTD